MLDGVSTRPLSFFQTDSATRLSSLRRELAKRAMPPQIAKHFCDQILSIQQTSRQPFGASVLAGSRLSPRCPSACSGLRRPDHLTGPIL